LTFALRLSDAALDSNRLPPESPPNYDAA
jgi:hypothetical protein